MIVIETGKADTLKAYKLENGAFVAGESFLGCCAYSWMSGIVMGEFVSWYWACAAGMSTPLACLAGSAIYATYVGVKPHGALASFTGGVDGLWWGFLTNNALAASGYQISSAQYWSTILIPSMLLNAGWLAYSQAFGASEGSYLTKTLFSFSGVYYYFQIKKTVLGDYMRVDSTTTFSDAISEDLKALPFVSVGSGIGGFLITAGRKNYTAGDAFFLSSNMMKGSFVLSNIAKEIYIQTFWSASKWEEEEWKYPIILVTGYYPGSSTMNRIDGALQITGAIAGALATDYIVKRSGKHMSTLGGLVYTLAPFAVQAAVWSFWPPLLATDVDPRIYGNLIPALQVGLDLGVSYIVWNLFAE